MSDTIVPHVRFLEIRQRRRRAVEEQARHDIAPPNGDSLDAQPVTIDTAALGDEHCGTRTAVPKAVRMIVPVGTTSRPPIQPETAD